jgi:LacI family transcriptional regulator
MRARKSVALLVETSNAYGRGILRGVMAYVRQHQPWALRLTEHGRGELGPHELAEWQGQGIIARIENRRIANALGRFRCPVVDVSAARMLPKLPWVETDDAAIAKAAADHLLARGLAHFGFFGDDRFNWSRWRAQVFDEYLAAAGHKCHHAPQNPGKNANRIVRWVRSLAKPAGVMACYDIRGRELIDACRAAGVKIPDEVAVVGVDDDELLCELCDPPLSSVIPDVRRTGWVAAEILDGLMAGRRPRSLHHPIPPLGVTTRRSSDMLAVEDSNLAAAVRFIRENACLGITVEDVVGRVPMSRRVLESRFEKVLGHSPHSEILRVRLDRVKQLLTQPGWTLDAIAHRTGFRHGEYLSTVFKRETGLTPGAYRRQHRLE